MEGKFITVIAYLFGEQKKHLDGVVSIENPHDTTLRATIAKAIKQEKPQLPFSANNHIHRVTSPSGTNIGVMLDHPVIHAVKKIKGDEFVVIIDNGSSSTPIQEQTTGKAAASAMVAMNHKPSWLLWCPSIHWKRCTISNTDLILGVIRGRNFSEQTRITHHTTIKSCLG